jgi:hypothetical protein
VLEIGPGLIPGALGKSPFIVFTVPGDCAGAPREGVVFVCADFEADVSFDLREIPGDPAGEADVE